MPFSIRYGIGGLSAFSGHSHFRTSGTFHLNPQVSIGWTVASDEMSILWVENIRTKHLILKSCAVLRIRSVIQLYSHHVFTKALVPSPYSSATFSSSTQLFFYSPSLAGILILFAPSLFVL